MKDRKALEMKVGVFVLIGLALIAVMVLTFGDFGERFEASYRLNVTFPNASGLLKNSYVYYAGAPIGRVTAPPKVINEGRAVEVPVRIHNDVKIRKDARWIVGASGLLGDRFVDVQPLEYSNAPFLKDGDTVEGTRSPGISDLAERTEPLVEEATQMARELRQIVHKFNKDVLTQESTDKLKDAFSKLNSILDRMDSILALAQEGKGPLATLLTDKQTTENLTTFIANLRKHGILFYSDDSKKKGGKDKEGKKTDGAKIR
jgi:phospholipid/cholesterol/gamma-HCH transport system substrate-binding protein